MASLNMSIKHGMSWDAARANFVKSVGSIESNHHGHIKRVEWSDDRTSAQLTGPGIAVRLKLDAESVHATGTIPFYMKLLEAPIRKYIEHEIRAHHGH